MNGILIATMLMGGGSAVAMQNTEINTAVSETAVNVMTQVKNMFRGSQVENIKENGFSCVNEEWLSSLTEDQQIQINSTIDVINATYDFQNMTDEEIEDALVLIKAEMSALYLELGVEAPAIQTFTQTRRQQGNRWNEDFVPGSGDCDNLPTDDLEDDSGDAV